MLRALLVQPAVRPRQFCGLGTAPAAVRPPLLGLTLTCQPVCRLAEHTLAVLSPLRLDSSPWRSCPARTV